MKRGWLPQLARDRQVEAAGVALIAFGCLLTGIVWSGVRTATNVAYQLPIIASGGILAMGCFTVGGLLLAGGMVMTRFARQERSRRFRRVPAPPPADSGAPLPEEAAERREAVRRRVAAGSPSEN